MLIHAGGESKAASMFGSADDWHELRFLLLDEVEAAGSGLLGRLEDNLRLQVPSTNVASEGLRVRQHRDRGRRDAFAGVNALCFGDFWQLDPTGDVAIMSNPAKTPDDPFAQRTLDMFWYSGEDSQLEGNYNLQAWGRGLPRIWELSTNIRSGEDEWLSAVLNECRDGNLSEGNYNSRRFAHPRQPIQKRCPGKLTEDGKNRRTY